MDRIPDGKQNSHIETDSTDDCYGVWVHVGILFVVKEY